MDSELRCPYKPFIVRPGRKSRSKDLQEKCFLKSFRKCLFLLHDVHHKQPQQQLPDILWKTWWKVHLHNGTSVDLCVSGLDRMGNKWICRGWLTPLPARLVLRGVDSVRMRRICASTTPTVSRNTSKASGVYLQPEHFCWFIKGCFKCSSVPKRGLLIPLRKRGSAENGGCDARKGRQQTDGEKKRKKEGQNDGNDELWMFFFSVFTNGPAVCLFRLHADIQIEILEDFKFKIGIRITINTVRNSRRGNYSRRIRKDDSVYNWFTTNIKCFILKSNLPLQIKVNI